MIAVPNSLVAQWGKEFRQLYPQANILVTTEKDFTPQKRKEIFAKIALGNWDAVIIGHSQFDMLHLSKDAEEKAINAEIQKLETALYEADNYDSKFSVKKIESTIEKYKTRLEKVMSRSAEDDLLSFEKLGIDKLFIDESQNYKNLDIPTKLHNVAGLGGEAAAKSMNLLMKCRYLDELTGSKGVVFASGTPIITGYQRSGMPILRCLCRTASQDYVVLFCFFKAQY